MIIGKNRDIVLRKQAERADKINTAVLKVQWDNDGMSYAAAWEQVRSTMPELFAELSADETTVNLRPDGTTESLSKARAKVCSLIVREIQETHPGKSFEESWRIAARRSPKLFSTEPL